jgi:hypothetical protein
MNKNLILAILVVSLIPAFFNIGRGISGLAIGDTTTASIQPIAEPSSGHFLSGAMLVYFIISLVVLSVVVSYLIALYHNDKKLPVVPKRNKAKHFEKTKSAFKGIKFSEISDEKASQYIVAVVAIVGLVAILILLLR